MSQVRAAVQAGTLGRYNLIERLGVGGQAEVWRAHDGIRGLDVALKIPAPALAGSASAWAALEREHALSERLRHAGILQVLPPERLDGYAVLPMELADGGTLTRLRGAGYLEIVPVLLEIAAALEYAHARGVVHRDLKPGNVLLDSRGRVKIADFGAAAVLPGVGEDAGAGPAILSPFSASPGQLRGEPVSPADDLYGFGALAYELLAGRPPHYPHFNAARIQAGAVPPLVPARPAPVRLIELVMRLLAGNPAERPASMREVIDELEATLNSTLEFAPADLADLVGEPLAGPPPAPVPVTPAGPGQSSGAERSAPRGPPEPAASPAPVPAAAVPQPQPPAPMRAAPQPLDLGLGVANPREPFIGGRDAPAAPAQAPRRADRRVTYLHPVRGPGVRGAPAGERGSKRPSHRLRDLLSGLVCGVLLAVGGLHWLSHHGFRGGPLHMLSTVAVRVREGRGLRPAPPGAATAPPAGAAGTPQAAGGAPANPRATLRAEPGPRAPQRAAAMRLQAQRALGAQLSAGQAALDAQHARAAARAFALARRIDPASRRAREGARQARRLAAAQPWLAAARRAEHDHDYARAAADLRRALARDPADARARAALRRIPLLVNRDFQAAGYARALRAGLTAFGNGRLFQAQADFQQALVFRPRGREAAAELAEVNAALRQRYRRR